MKDGIAVTANKISRRFELAAVVSEVMIGADRSLPRKTPAIVWTGKSGSYPKMDVRQGKTRWRYATSIYLGETGFLEFSHHFSTEMYVDTRE